MLEAGEWLVLKVDMSIKQDFIQSQFRLRGDLIRQKRLAKSLSQAALAELVGTSQQTVDRIERGATGHSRAVEPILQELGLPVEEFSTAAIEASFSESEKRFERDDEFKERHGYSELTEVPIYSIRDGSFSGTIADKIRRPDVFRHVYDLYGVIVPDGNLSPIYREGDTVFMNPNIPARAGNEVLMRFNQGQGRATAWLAVLQEVQEGAWVLAPHARRTEPFELSMQQWAAHVVVMRLIRV